MTKVALLTALFIASLWGGEISAKGKPVGMRACVSDSLFLDGDGHVRRKFPGIGHELPRVEYDAEAHMLTFVSSSQQRLMYWTGTHEEVAIMVCRELSLIPGVPVSVPVEMPCLGIGDVLLLYVRVGGSLYVGELE